MQQKFLRRMTTEQGRQYVKTMAASRIRLFTRHHKMLNPRSTDAAIINLPQQILTCYKKLHSISKDLFENFYWHENHDKKRLPIIKALDLAAAATQAQEFKDWWWKVQLGRCYYRLGLFRDAEKQFKSALQNQDNISTVLLLGRVYIRLDQPMGALEVYKNGLDKFPGEVTLQTGIARIYEGLHDLTKAVKFYKNVLNGDATHVEAIACIGTHHFYTDQPEVALRFYRRLLQMGIYNCEIFNNLGLCCFYAQQYDMTLTCFERALSLATDESVADVWYNLGHIALGIGDINLGYQCFRLALVSNNDHGESYNNLGVLEYRRGNPDTAKAFFMTAASLAPHCYQPHYNYARLAHQMGDLQTSYIIVQKALAVFPSHVDSKELLKNLQAHFHTL
ncbi:unnamed protein product, partial [Meganyctiphanes norvegica]